jgi:hypothetical protein
LIYVFWSGVFRTEFEAGTGQLDDRGILVCFLTVAADLSLLHIGPWFQPSSIHGVPGVYSEEEGGGAMRTDREANNSSSSSAEEV